MHDGGQNDLGRGVEEGKSVQSCRCDTIIAPSSAVSCTRNDILYVLPLASVTLQRQQSTMRLRNEWNE